MFSVTECSEAELFLLYRRGLDVNPAITNLLPLLPLVLLDLALGVDPKASLLHVKFPGSGLTGIAWT